MFKKILPILAVSALALSLVSCSSDGSASASCTPTKSGSASEKVTVTGTGDKTTAKFPKKLTVTTTQRTEIKAGKGREAKKGDTVAVDYVVYNATTGKKIDANSTANGVDFSLDTSQGLLSGLYKALRCAAPGARIAAVIPPADAFKSTGSTQLGIGATDSIVFVLDVVKVTPPSASTPTPTPAPSVSALPRANGTPQAAPAGYPTVKLASSGAPTITVPKTKAPTKLEIADLKKGKGDTVQDGDTVTVHYTGVIWDTNKVFDSSWVRGTPATFQTSGVIPGFAKALVGQKVGSQVIAIIPPADGYGSAGQGDIKGTDTLVFVVDILATTR